MQRKRGISTAHFLARELDAHAGSLEFDLRTLKRAARVPPSSNIIKEDTNIAATTETSTADSIGATCTKAVGLATSLLLILETADNLDGDAKAATCRAAKFLSYELELVACNVAVKVRQFAGDDDRED